MKWSKLHNLKRFLPLLSIGFLLLALVFARRQLTLYHITHISDLVFSVPGYVMEQAICLTALGYLVLTSYDQLALRYIGKVLPLGKTLRGAFVSFAISHNAGHPMVSGTSLRMRYYTPQLNGLDIIKIALIDSLTYALGLLMLFLLAYGAVLAGWADVPVPGIELIGAVFAGVYIAYWASVIWWKPVLEVKSLHLKLPHVKLTLAQMVVGCTDVAISGLVLHTFLSTMIDIPLGEFYVIYVLSLVLGTFSQVPGGLGVMEGLFIHLLSYHYPDVTVLPSLILYRIVYYFLPLGIAGGMHMWHEANHHRLGLRLRILKRSYDR